MFDEGPDQGRNPADIVEEKGLKQVTDTVPLKQQLMR